MAGKRISSAERKKQIINNATVLFSERGYEKTTIADLANACGITEPALYRHFKSKQDIYDEVLNSLKDRVNIDELAAKVKHSDDIHEILYSIARHILKTFVLHSELPRLLMFSVLENQSGAKNVFSIIRLPYVEMLKDSLDRLLKTGKIRAVEPIITARCFVGMVMDCAMGVNLWNKWQGKTFSSQKTMQNNVGIFARGLKIDDKK